MKARKPMELMQCAPYAPGDVITPPYVHKLIKQLAEAVKEATPDLFDPTYNRGYTFDLSISVQEARAIIDFNTLLNGPLEGFAKYDEEGRLIES